MSSLTNYIKSIPYKIGLSKKQTGNTPGPPPDPKGQQRASYRIKPQPKRSVSYQIEDIKKALQAAGNPETPNRELLTMIYYYIMQDSHLSCQINIAIQKVLAEPFALYDQSGNKIEDASKLIRNSWFEQILTHILEVEFWGFRMVECVVSKDGVPEISIIPNENVCPELEVIWLTRPYNDPRLPYTGITDQLSLVFMGKPGDYGLLQKAAYNVIWKYYSRSDWSRASEKFGMPILKIEANTNNSTELDRLEDRAANFGHDGYIVTQSGDTAEIIERKGENIHKVYQDNIIYCDEQISKLINGQTGSSDEKSFTGAAQVHERLMEDITFARMRRAIYTLNGQWIPYLKARKIIPDTVAEFDFIRFKEPAKTTAKSGNEQNPENKPDPKAK